MGALGAESLRSFLVQLGQATPTPAGGSSIALVAAEAAAFLEMVYKMGAQSGSEGPRTLTTTARGLGAGLIGAMSDDATAYQTVLRATSPTAAS